MRFFELFLKNNNLIKQGLYLLEICKHRLGRRTSRRIVMVTTDRHGLRRPILMQFLQLLFFITLDGKYDGPSQAQRFVEVLRSKTLQLLEYGYWDYFSELHDEYAGRTIIDTTDRHKLRNPHLVKHPHLPSAAALRYHLRTVTSTTDRHKLRRWSLLHFFAQNLRIHLWTDFLQNKEKLI